MKGLGIVGDGFRIEFGSGASYSRNTADDHGLKLLIRFRNVSKVYKKGSRKVTSL